jgi:predicted nucleic acid-binding protein
MTDRAFIDTNVWVYAVDTADRAKQARALEILAASADKDYVISAQVLGEFYATVTGKLRTAVAQPDGRAMVERMKRLPVVPIDTQLVSDAIDGTQEWQISYWDALIISAARSAGCRVVLTEDLADGGSYGPVRVENPFREGPWLGDKPALRRG